jgi:lysophospholipid acyltransferase (LPLAT)-like uncharacterized protein
VKTRATWFRAALGVALGIFARVYLLTLRARVLVDPALELGDPRPFVLCFWHGEQLALFTWKRRRKTVALVSLSPDGQMQARALRLQGLWVERGSTSRAGARGLLAIVARLREGHDAAFAVDGPRGPRHGVAPGAGAAARLSGGILVPMGTAAARAVTLAKTWDQFRVPLPFSRVTVYLGAPVDPSASADDVGTAIARAGSLARAALGVVRSDEDAILRRARCA